VKRDGNDYFDLYMRAQEETKQVFVGKSLAIKLAALEFDNRFGTKPGLTFPI